MRIGLDMDGLLDEQPEFFRLLSTAFRGQGHYVAILTYRDPDSLARTEASLAEWGISYTPLESQKARPKVPPALGCYRKEERHYTPHITLGRVKSDRPTDRLALALAKQAAWKGGDVAVQEIHVMSSELTSQGPVYTVLSRAKLAKAL